METYALTVPGPPGTETVTFVINAQKSRNSRAPWFARDELRAGRLGFAAAALVDIVIDWDVVWGDQATLTPITKVSVEGLGVPVMMAMALASIDAVWTTGFPDA